MSLTATEKREFQPISEGLHPAVCCEVIDLGTQHSEKFGTDAPKVMIGWELLDEARESEEGDAYNLCIRKEYTNSLSPKSNLRKCIETWFSKAMTAEQSASFDLRKLLGRHCQIQITHTKKNDRTYSNVAAVVPWPKGMPTQAGTRGHIVYEMGDVLTDEIPEWIANKITASPDYNMTVPPKQEPSDDTTEEAPF